MLRVAFFGQRLRMPLSSQALLLQKRWRRAGFEDDSYEGPPFVGGNMLKFTPLPGLKKKPPITNGTRNALLPLRSHLYKGRCLRILSHGKRRKAGRYYTGQITCRHKGGKPVSRRRLRQIDYARRIEGYEGIVERMEYDPNRSAWLALVRYPELNMRPQYIVAVDGMKPGDLLASYREQEPKLFTPGSAMPLGKMPAQTQICCVELFPGKGAQLARSAGTSMRILEKQSSTRPGFSVVETPSKEHRLIRMDCIAVIGRVSNPWWNQVNWGKAGRVRRRGVRPAVKGRAMNAVDHPHGGGTAKKRRRSPYGGGARTPWGKGAHEHRSRRCNWKEHLPIDERMIVKRRPKVLKWQRHPLKAWRKKGPWSPKVLHPRLAELSDWSDEEDFI